MNQEHLFLDLILSPDHQFHLWSGEASAEFAGLLPATANYTYESLDHVTMQPLRDGISSGFPTMRLGLALPEGHALDPLLRATRTRWMAAMRLATDLSAKPALTPHLIFLGDAFKQEKSEGLWSIEVRHYLHRLETEAPDPAMGVLNHQLTYPGDLGFAYMEQAHNFLSNWSP